jgi:pimeloyl-ACP methyl ester carboxylesterase
MNARWCSIAIGTLVILSSLPARSLEIHTDYVYKDQDNDDEVLVMFIAGLGGEGSWRRLTRFIDSDPDFGCIDYLVYHSPEESNIAENIGRAQTILGQYREDYDQTILVGHSIGGIMIKRALLIEAGKSPEERRLPDMVITFGTPLDVDKFTVTLFKRLGARIFWFRLPPLHREVFNLDRIKQINSNWRAEVERSPIKDIRRVNIFGVDDKIAPSRVEGDSQDTIFIAGDHMGIITPESTSACSWIVFRTAVLEPSAIPREIDCVLPPE